MEAKRRSFFAKLTEDVRSSERLIEMNKKSIENIKRVMCAGKDIEFFRDRIEKTEQTNSMHEEKILTMRSKMDITISGGCDVEINLIYTTATEIFIKKTAKKDTESVLDNEEDVNIGKTFAKKDYEEGRHEKYMEKSMTKEYNRFLDVSATLPDYMANNLKSMPNNKGYKWRGITFFGALPAENGPVLIFEKSKGDTIITEITPTAINVSMKTKDNQKKVLSRKKRCLNMYGPATVI